VLESKKKFLGGNMDRRLARSTAGVDSVGVREKKKNKS
jgi:hypothetical protein